MAKDGKRWQKMAKDGNDCGGRTDGDDDEDHLKQRATVWAMGCGK